MDIKDLLKPFKLKTLKLPGQVVMTPMTRNRSFKHISGPELTKYYRRGAENHAGLIITEGAVVDAAGPGLGEQSYRKSI